jgi:hypothetical protein
VSKWAVIDLWIVDLAAEGWRDQDETTAGRTLASITGAVRGGLCNISHTDRTLALVCTRDRRVTHLGVDVERLRRVSRPDAFLKRVLRPDEIFRTTTDPVVVWTLKEAILKATLEGLAGDPRSWPIEWPANSPPTLSSAPARWGPKENWTLASELVDRPDRAALSVAARTIESTGVELRWREAVAPDLHRLSDVQRRQRIVGAAR